MARGGSTAGVDRGGLLQVGPQPAGSDPGPAIPEQPDATIFIEPDLTGAVDRFANLVITRKESC